METIKATWKNGQIIPDRPIDWPDGSRLVIEHVGSEETAGIPDAEWPRDPEGIAALRALMDCIKPLEMTPKEQAEWHAALASQKSFEKSKFDERSEELRKLWQ